MKAIIDRFEGNFAIIEYTDGIFKELPIDRLPEGCKEGDCLIIENETITIDKLETNKRTANIKKLMGDLF